MFTLCINSYLYFSNINRLTLIFSFLFLKDVVFFQTVLDLHKIIPVTNLLQIASIIVIMTPLFN